MNGPSSTASTVSQKCRVAIGETSGRGGLRWPWLVSGLQLLPSALGCLAGQRDGVVGEIQRRRSTPCLGRRRGVAAARRLAQVSGQLSQGETAGGFEVELAVLGGWFGGAREAWGRVGGLCVGSGFLGWGAGARRARRFFCDGYLSSGRWSFPCGMVSMGRRERSGVSDTGFGPLGPTTHCGLDPLPENALRPALRRSD